MQLQQSVRAIIEQKGKQICLFTVTRKDSGHVSEYIECGIPGYQCTSSTTIYENENELTSKFIGKDQDPLVLLKHPSDENPNLFLLEDTRYYLEIETFGTPAENILSELKELDIDVEDVPVKDRYLYAIKFSGYVGKGSFDVTINGRIIELQFEVRSSKIEYLQQYPQMISDISEFFSSLLFHSDAPLASEISLNERPSGSFYEDYILIEYMFSKLNLEDLLGYVCNNIHRELISEKRVCYNGEAYNIDPSSIIDMMMNGGIVPDVVTGTLNVFRTVNTDSIDTYDTPENRLVKDFLIVLTTTLERLEECPVEGYIRTRIHSLKNITESVLSEKWFMEVGTLERIPFDSNVLLSKYGYSDIFRMYLMLGIGLGHRIKDSEFIFEGHINKLPQTYEYWCYIQIFNALCSLSGKDQNHRNTMEKRWHTGIRRGVPEKFTAIAHNIPLEIELYYNHSTKKGSNVLESYSIPLRPDFTLLVTSNNCKRIINFDAKYKLQLIDLGDFTEDDDPVNTICWRADIYKMHTYRDAIYNCWGSYVLYPGKENSWYSKSYLEDPYDEDIPSVGAIPLAPGKDNVNIFKSRLEQILGLITEIESRELRIDPIY